MKYVYTFILGFGIAMYIFIPRKEIRDYTNLTVYEKPIYIEPYDATKVPGATEIILHKLSMKHLTKGKVK